MINKLILEVKSQILLIHSFILKIYMIFDG